MNRAAPEPTRLKACVRGAVQGVGFRPFVFRLASELGLAGWVNNTAQGVVLEIEGSRPELETFLMRLEAEKPPRSFIQSLEASWLDPAGFTAFEIRESARDGTRTALVLPDIATCPECVREVFDPQNRRYLYPFTNCTHCGPRFSIIESLPYDRTNTSMKKFVMCPACRAEYENPRDRRFHAQPNACPECGPHLELWRATGNEGGDASPETGNQRRGAARGPEALLAAAEAIRRGQIAAVKGLGGFHLMVAAHDECAVQRLRERKHREEKPFALMFPSLASVKAACEVSPLEARLLRSPEAPIVLLKRISGLPSSVTNAVAPGNPNLGVLLPYTPLHHLLMRQLDFPVVATSGNLSDEPICTDEREALERLGGIADVFLVHDRPIVRHADDSIVRVMLGRELVLRRARGYAPLPISLKPEIRNFQSDPVLAVGAHLKNTVALSIGTQVFISQHIGDLETVQAVEAFHRVIADFRKLYEAKAAAVAADAHPDYLSTKFAGELAARSQNARVVSVQHHVAHVLACMAENELTPPVLGVSWDGTGYGLDGTVWGGEFFLITQTGFERVAHLRQFRLPGGEQAVKEPRRSALGLLYELFGRATFEKRRLPLLRAFSDPELNNLKTMFSRGLNCPLTSSAGRLFDAVSALVGLRKHTRFEGQAAMDLEFALKGLETEGAYPLAVVDSPKSSNALQQPPLILDWAEMVYAILSDIQAGLSVSDISAKFHNALAEAIVTVAQRAGEERVALSGGCFQNRYLTEQTVRCLQAAGFRPYWHQRVPPNDGGIALGQIVAALRERR